MRARTWIAAAVLPLALSACSIGPLGRTTSTVAPHLLSPPPPARHSPDERPSAADPATDRPWPITRTLASGTIKDDAKDSADISVIALKRRGKLLDLVLSITAHSERADRIPVDTFIGAGPTAITLTDNAGLKRYLVVRDPAGRPMRSPGRSITVGEPTVRTYTFPAPAPEVAALDVRIGGEPPFRDVPVTP